MSEDKERKSSKKSAGASNDIDFRTFIKKSWKSVTSKCDKRSIDPVVIDQLNFILNRIGKYVVQKANNTTSKTFLKNDVLKSINSLIDPTYWKYLDKEVDEKLHLLEKRNKDKGSVSEDLGLIIPLPRVARFFKPYSKRKSLKAVVALTCFLNMLVRDALEETKNYTEHTKKGNARVRPECLYGSIFRTKNPKKPDEKISPVNEHYVRNMKGLLCKLNITILASGINSENNVHIRNRTKTTKTTREACDGHRFRAGTVANKEIEKFQKQTAYNLVTAQRPLHLLIKEIIDNDEIRISRNAVVVTQLYIENYIRNILRKANILSHHSNRIGVMKKDIDAVMKQDGDCNL
jgi:histone H3/H4